jgi:hypothetical protein
MIAKCAVSVPRHTLAVAHADKSSVLIEAICVTACFGSQWRRQEVPISSLSAHSGILLIPLHLHSP